MSSDFIAIHKYQKYLIKILHNTLEKNSLINLMLGFIYVK